MPNETIRWNDAAGRSVSRDEHYQERYRLVTELSFAFGVLRICRESEIAHPDDSEGLDPFGNPAPPTIPVAYRLETLPARYARAMRRPRQRLYSLESAYASVIQNLLNSKREIAEIFQHYDAAAHFPDTEVLDFDIRAATGRSLKEITSEVGRLLGNSQDIVVPSVATLPYTRYELGHPFPTIAIVSEKWLILRKLLGKSEAQASAEVIDQHVGPDGVRVLAGRIGEFHELLATSRAEDGSELGLADPAAPSRGWLTWYRELLVRFEGRLAEAHAAADPAAPLVVAPADTVPADPPGLADPRYRYAARFYAAYEGAAISDSAEITSEAVLRFSRVHNDLILKRSPADYLVYDQVQRLLADASANSGLLWQVLGPVTASGGRTVNDALGCAIGWVAPSDLPFGWPHEPKEKPELEDLPMNRWEVRFKFPEILELCASAGSPVRPGTLNAAAEAFTAAREPCRVWLPPVVGEIRELLALLPSDQDLDHAMNHLGAAGSGWRTPLDRVASAFADHISAHADDLDGPVGPEE